MHTSMGTEMEEESRPASDAVYDAVMTSECSASAKSATLRRGDRGCILPSLTVIYSNKARYF
jgi:hypothetical protein